MSNAIARRRAAKALRRKAVVSIKRKQAHAEMALSLAERIERATREPIHCCLLQEEALLDNGTGTLVLARRVGFDEFVLAAFLIDAYCLGVKDVALQWVDAATLELYLGAMDAAGELIAIDPGYARRLVREAVAYAQGIGFAPYRDYEVAERLFGDVAVDTSEAPFAFGLDGKPFYVPGPSATPAQIRRTLERLRERLGDGGFDFVIPVGGDDDDIGPHGLDEALDTPPRLEAPRR
jgi:hypothetical protein